MEKTGVRISQIMIVKNEEKNLERALSWGKGIVCEQIVVDTGSTDRTVEIALSMGAKVYHFKWIDDFAAAKNYAIERASGDWIAFLDADEYLTKEWAERLISLLESLQGTSYCAVRSPLINLDGETTQSIDRHCRVFRRMPGLGYAGAFHEQLALNGGNVPDEYILDTGGDFPVYHTGYAAEVYEKKRARNIRILKEELKKRPDSYDLMGYLGDVCASERREDREEAERWYRTAVALMPERLSVRDERSATTWINLLVLMLQLNREEREMLEVYEQARRKVPWVYDIDHIMGSYYWERKVYEKAAFHLEAGFQVAEQYGASSYGVYMTKNIARTWEILAECFWRTGQTQKALYYCITLLKTDKRRLDSLVTLLTLLEGEKPGDILAFLGNLYDIRQPSDRIFLLRAVLRVHAEGLLALLREECSEEELSYLDRLKEQ